jgi:SARP family transcriptional regulator, regulator of embCAB operon
MTSDHETEARGAPLRAGCDAHPPSFRVYLAGDMCLESAGRIVGERQLPGPLGRHLLAMLAAEHNRPIGNDELAEEIWHGAPPPAWATSLKAFVSRTRAVITAAGMDGGSLIVGAPGVYRFVLPPGAWVDVDAAKSATHEAEGKLANGDLVGSAQHLFVAKVITNRPFLPGMTGQWLERRRAEFAELRIRALQCSARVNLANDSSTAAVGDAKRAVDADPLREPSWWLLMDAHAAIGDLASAIAAYERCRSTLDQALGIAPSPATRERHAALVARPGVPC